MRHGPSLRIIVSLLLLAALGACRGGEGAESPEHLQEKLLDVLQEHDSGSWLRLYPEDERKQLKAALAVSRSGGWFEPPILSYLDVSGGRVLSQNDSSAVLSLEHRRGRDQLCAIKIEDRWYLSLEPCPHVYDMDAPSRAPTG